VNRFIFLVIAFAIAFVGPAYAGGIYLYRSAVAAATSPAVAGLIGDDGRILHGRGFTVKHPGTGHYHIEFDPGIFPSGCASMTVEGFDRPVLSSVFFYPVLDCRFPEWHVVLIDPQTKEPVDAIFQFIAVEAPRH
jgi:hypothetical protein